MKTQTRSPASIALLLATAIAIIGFSAIVPCDFPACGLVFIVAAALIVTAIRPPIPRAELPVRRS